MDLERAVDIKGKREVPRAHRSGQVLGHGGVYQRAADGQRLHAHLLRVPPGQIFICFGKYSKILEKY